MPRQEAALLDGGSIFWVIKGLIMVRQSIVARDEVIGSDGIRRCAIVLDPHLILTETRRKRPFQGWRYLKAAAAPRDLSRSDRSAERLPPPLQAALAEIGVR